jgi:transposase InsO family protein
VLTRAGAATTLTESAAIWHSACGSVSASAEFWALVTGLGMRSSMGRTGVCWDDSMAEIFFSMLKNERVYRTAYATKSQVRSDVIRYIEGFYNIDAGTPRCVIAGLMKSIMVINSQHWQRRTNH